MSKGYRHATRLETFKIHALLAENLEVITPQIRNDNDVLVTRGLVKYKPGFSDEQLAKQIGNDLPEKSVANIRLDMFGAMQAPHGATPDARISALERRLEDLMKANTHLSLAITEITDKHNKLADQLSINQITNARHLKVV